MNRTELIDLISDKAEITKAAASRALDALLEGVTASLQKGDPVVLVNSTLERWVTSFQEALIGLNASEKELIYHQNAIEFYQLEIL